MSEREPWKLLADLDALLSRDGWRNYGDEIRAMERRIAFAVDMMIHLSRPFDLLIPIRMELDECDEDDPAPPFLRSRDAAAMLEATIPGYCIEMRSAYSHLSEWQGNVWITVRSPEGVILPLRHAPEAAWRTRAALEAGFRVGLWPVRRDG